MKRAFATCCLVLVALALTACPPATGHDQVMIPGDPERRRLKDRLENGMPVPREVWQNILDAGAALGLSPEALGEPQRVAEARLAEESSHG